jgi:anaerobic selenocysteine-containing dehydrogenase
VELPEARSDVDIVCDLARRLGVGEHFWEDSRGLYDFLLEPTGLTFQAFKEKKRIYAPLVYRQFEKNGFNTPSGKVELYSTLLEKNGCAPLPTYTVPVESAAGAPRRAAEYPYILTTGWRPSAFRHTENRENPILRELFPRPSLQIHPDTAGTLGISEGDPVIVETEAGGATLFAVLTLGIHPDVVRATPGWRNEANINRVIPWSQFAEGIGSVPMRGVLCRLRRGIVRDGAPVDEGKR